MNELTLPKKGLLEIFSTVDGLDKYFQEIKEQSENLVFDMDDPKSRAELRTLANDIRKSKVVIEKAGKDQADKAKEIPKLIDAERRKSKKQFDDYIEKIRKPLTDWEQVEKDRVAAIELAISNITIYKETQFIDHSFLETAQAELITLEKIDVTDGSFQEFVEKAELELKIAKLDLASIISKLKDERLIHENAEKIRIENERKAQEEREAKLIADAKAEAERIAAEEAEAVRIAKDQAIIDAQAAHEKAIKDLADKAEADKQAILNEQARLAQEAETAKKNAEMANDLAKANAIAEQAQKAQKEKDDAIAREANETHKATINNEVLEDLMLTGLNKDQAKKVVIFIAQGKIRNTKISY